MKKIIISIISALAFSFGLWAQNDTMFIHIGQSVLELPTQSVDSIMPKLGTEPSLDSLHIYKNNIIVNSLPVNKVDSIIFYRAASIAFSLGEISFKTENIWSVGKQEWSDVVMASGCGKEQFNGGQVGALNVDCRNNDGHGDLFSWAAIDEHKEELCPEGDGWRVPNTDDFGELNLALGGQDVGVGAGYTDANIRDSLLYSWGATLGGGCRSNGALENVGGIAYYWAQTEFDADQGDCLFFNRDGFIFPQNKTWKVFGIMLRCVRDNDSIVVSPMGNSSFKTENIWTIGAQEWSDVVMASGCKDDTLISGGNPTAPLADCRKNPGYGDLFTWAAVTQYKEQLCPEAEGWRVPTRDDFAALNLEAGGQDVAITASYTDTNVRNTLLSDWGATYGGQCTANGTLQSSVGTQAFYWTQTAHDNMNGACFSFTNAGSVIPKNKNFTIFGQALRCVKDKVSPVIRPKAPNNL